MEDESFDKSECGQRRKLLAVEALRQFQQIFGHGWSAPSLDDSGLSGSLQRLSGGQHPRAGGPRMDFGFEEASFYRGIVLR